MNKFYILVLLTVIPFQKVFLQNGYPDFMHETIDMPYMPPNPDSKTTEAFSYDTVGFFMRQVNVSLLGFNIQGDAANEPSIAVDPTNPDRMVIGWRQFDNVNSSFRQAGYAYTKDGGQTWVNRGVLIDPGNFRSDPVLDFDKFGNFYYNSLGVNSNDDMWTDVYRILNAGFDWDDGVYALGGDKQWMRIDRTNGEGSGNIYAAWTEYYSICNGNFTRSVDGGDSYEPCVSIVKSPYWGTLAVAPDGTLYQAGASYQYGTGAVLVKSENAQNSGENVQWQFVSWIDLDGFITAGTPINPQGLLGQVWIDIDKSGGPGNGNIYVMATVVASGSNDHGDVMFTRSTDGGLTWDPPIKINDDNNDAYYQWMGTMSVAPDGRIDVVWLDTRDAPSGHPHNSALYYSCSLDNGESFSVNRRLSPLFDPHLGYPQQNKMGDYFDMVSDNQGAHLAWAGTFNGEEDVYYGYITPSDIMGQKELHKNGKGINLEIYPNPVSDYVSVKSKENDVINSVEILTVQDRVIKRKSFTKKKATIETREIPAGVYILKAYTGRGIAVTKFVKD